MGFLVLTICAKALCVIGLGLCLGECEHVGGAAVSGSWYVAK
jgi:hypothetical protein